LVVDQVSIIGCNQDLDLETSPICNQPPHGFVTPRTIILGQYFRLLTDLP